MPTEVAMFDKLKVGDKVDIDYGESLAVEMLPPGSKPSQSEQVARAPGMAGREMTVSAEVVAVDPASNHVTFKGPSGNVETIAVRDPAMQQKLPNIKAGTGHSVHVYPGDHRRHPAALEEVASPAGSARAGSAASQVGRRRERSRKRPPPPRSPGV